MPVGARSAYFELSRQPNELALVNAAVVIAGDPISHARVAVGGFVPHALRLAAVENALLHNAVADAPNSSAATSDVALSAVPEPNAPGAYRVRMAPVVVKRALGLRSADVTSRAETP